LNDGSKPRSRVEEGIASVPETEPVIPLAQRPRLVFFYSPLSGRCRRVEGFVAQVLQHRRNHDTFDLVRVSVDRRPDLAEKFRIEQVPSICVVEGGKLRLTIATPRGCRELERKLEPWLR
jgi:Thioredoxin